MFSILWIALLPCFAWAAFTSNTIAGSVRNQSRGQPAVGDEVVLIRLDQGMQEEEHTRTGPGGAFWLRMQHPDKPYLVRVRHQNVNYDERAPAGGVITIPVFDAADHVPGISGTIEIMRAGTIGESLHVSDMFEIRNASSPPFTQAGERAFEVFLPADAKVDSVLAAGPEKIGVMISAMPVSGKPGHYSVSFPLRPGATKFAFNYDLPYKGAASFRTWHAYPLQQLAVLIPTTMKFSSLSPKFQILQTGAGNYQVRAIGQVMAGQGPAFTISGAGEFPPALPHPTKTTAPSLPPVLPRSITSAPDHTAPPLSGDVGASSLRPTLKLLLVCCALLASCTFTAWRARKKRAHAMRGSDSRTATRGAQPAGFLDDLKNRLFQLESARVCGSVSETEYASARQELEQTVERALAGRQEELKGD